MLRAQLLSLHLLGCLARALPAQATTGITVDGSNWAVAAVDADGRLLHCGRGLAEAMAALERVLPAGETGK